MQSWKQFVIAFFLAIFTLLSLSSYSLAANGSLYNGIVFFGDSLTDNGNLYSYDFGLFPKSPPYYNGRFSNGNVWSDMVAEHYHLFNVTTENYAVGGETAILHDSSDVLLPYTLTQSLDTYYVNDFKDQSQLLYIIWIGANDYLSGNSNTDKVTSDVVNAIQSDIEGLISHGAKNLLILNLPDLSKTPAGIANANRENLSVLSTLHNTKLEMAVTALQTRHAEVNIHLYDIYKLFNDLTSTPEVFNNQFHTHLKNTTGACWKGGYMLKQLSNKPAVIQAQLATEGEITQNVDTKALANYISSSPDLTTAYDTSRRFLKGETPCSDADSYVFWDTVHPTTTAHFILSSLITAYIDQNYQHS